MPSICPFEIDMLFFFAKRLLPSITKAKCSGMGPCRSVVIRSSSRHGASIVAGASTNSRNCKVHIVSRLGNLRDMGDWGTVVVIGREE